MDQPRSLGLAFFLFSLLPDAPAAQVEDWPQWRGPNRDGVWKESGIFETFPSDGLKVRSSAPVERGWSSPVVAEGFEHFFEA